MDYVNEGETLEYTNNTGSAISAGDPVVVGDCVGRAQVDIANGEEGVVLIVGRMKSAAKVSGTAWSQGDELDWDSSEEAFTKDLTPAASGDVQNCAIAAEDATSAATTAEIILSNPGTAS